MLKCWRDVPGYKLFVKDKWNSFQVDGWGGYVIKEKLKMIKVALKDWHTAHIQNLPSRIESLKERLSVLDQKGEEEDLSGVEVAELHGVTADIHSLSRLHTSISWQQSRSMWLKEGNANSKFLHSVLAGCRRRNAISVIQEGGVTVEGVSPIRQAVFSHFASHFKSFVVEKPGWTIFSLKGIISSIESLLIKFFWGGCEDTRKIAWINWKTICLRKEYGGLGVRQLREFNLALLGKWCWRMLVDREGLWFRVLAARYGVEGGRLRDGGRRGSSWWREIARIREGVDESGGRWFGEHVVRRVGDGSDTLFWTDPWLDEIPSCERFGRLYVLSETKSFTVAEMFTLGWGLDGAAWVWRRQMRAWEEEMLGECQTLLSNISLQVQIIDRWQWQPDPDTGYTVQGAYELLTTLDSVTMDDAEHLIWHSQVPLKVSIFAWRLLRDRLPTKSNLISRGILSSAAHLCISGCGEAESAYHLFISCSCFGSLWALACTWIGIPSMSSTTIRDHFVQFTYLAGGSRARRSFLQLIWLASV
ncbi:unnamed protein product [Trifolium pratense]|uniref:Uncharacterized protein n=1 Tax=Trifolium pratense TaxID=57577 RepID=A0ACB0IPV7_TRIPR|nr:unnamed protein product [Trifolium pratense]